MNNSLNEEDLKNLRLGYYKEHGIGTDDKSLLLIPKVEQDRLISLGSKPPSFFEKLGRNFGIVLTFIILFGGYALFQIALQNEYFLWLVAILGSPVVVMLIIIIGSRNR